MMMKHKRAKAYIEADLQQHNYYKRCNVLVIVRGSQHICVGGSTPKRKDQPTPVTNAPADDKMQHTYAFSPGVSS